MLQGWAVTPSQRRDSEQSKHHAIAVSQNCNVVMAKWRVIALSGMHGIAMLRSRGIVIAHFRAIANEGPMKKHANASNLAAKLSAAANQPAGTGKSSAPVLVSDEPNPQPEALQPAKMPVRSKPKKAKVKEATVIITLRPSVSLWNKFVLKASDRMREQGRAVSAQQIMLEVLERSGI